jgi:hypothetical protein
MKTFLMLVVVAAVSSLAPLPLAAADEKPKTEQKAKAPRAIPFRGKIDAVDMQAKTIKVGERTFQITSDTRIMKAGKPATLENATVGEEVGGAYREGEDKKLNLVSLRVGPRPEAPKQEGK